MMVVRTQRPVPAFVAALFVAIEAAGAGCAPAVSSRPIHNPTWLPDLTGTDPGRVRRRVPLQELSHHHRRAMARAQAVNIDLKVSFELFDMTPGEKGRRFIRNLLSHGGRADARGFSLADAFLRQDEGAIVGPAFAGGAFGAGGPAPGAVA